MNFFIYQPAKVTSLSKNPRVVSGDHHATMQHGSLLKFCIIGPPVPQSPTEYDSTNAVIKFILLNKRQPEIE